MIKTRILTPSDLEMAAKIEAMSFTPEEAASHERMAQRLDVYADRYMFLLVNDEPVGYIGGPLTKETKIVDEMFEDVSFHDPNADWQSIFSLAVLPEHQNRGYAYALMEAYIEKCRQDGLSGVYLTCREHLVSYYAQFGYVNEGLSQSQHGGYVWYDMIMKF